MFALLLVVVAFLAGAFFAAVFVLVAVFFAGAFLAAAVLGAAVLALVAAVFFAAGLASADLVGPPASFTGPEAPVEGSEVSTMFGSEGDGGPNERGR